MPQIIFKSGSEKGSVIEFDNAVVLGRSKECDVLVPDEKVSRRHCSIIFEDGKWYVSDLGSRNGTFLNELRVEREVLSDGDRIRVGGTVLAFFSEPPQPVFSDLEEEADTLELRGDEVFMTRRVERSSRFLLQFSARALDADSMSELFESLVECVDEALEPDRTIPIIKTPEGILAYQKKSTPYRKLSRLPISRSIVERVIDSGKAVMLRGETPAIDSPSIRRYGIGSVIAVPIGSVKGVLYADRLSEGEPFNESDLELLEAFALMLSGALQSLQSREKLERTLRSLELEIQDELVIVGKSEALSRISELIEKASLVDSNVLILGESGTGKELVARAIHHSSTRKHSPFEAVNCAALTETLFESELFGHRKGAFTGAESDKPGRFELAHSGTLFLDEISELPHSSQAKLLRAIETKTIRRLGDTQDRTVDVRIISATNRNLHQLVKEGNFREDLFWRLRVIEIVVPPLRERREDIVPLAEHFLQYFSAKCGKPQMRFTDDALQALLHHPYPGNVRELKNLIERVVVLSESTEITPEELLEGLLPATAQKPAELLPLDELERQHILRVLEKVGGNKAEAARILGIDRSTLYSRLKSYRIT